VDTLNSSAIAAVSAPTFLQGVKELDTYRVSGLKCDNPMIRSFKCQDTQRIWQGESTRKFPEEIQNRALRKLRQIDAATRREDLRIPPANRLEILKGDRAGQMSIRINDQWRICFRWSGRDAWDVEIVDYH
jgi:toxin HigB-1